MMKTIKTLLICLLLIGLADSAQAQFRLGPLVAFGTDTDLGLGAKAKFDLNDKFKISPSFIFLGSDKTTLTPGKITATIFEINGDVHYAFSETESVLFYGIGGLNFISANVKISGTGILDGSASSSEIGLNLGAGGEFSVGNGLNAFAEAKFGIGGSDQLLISGGVYFNLGE